MSEPQHLQALARANEIRFAHVAIRKQIKAGTITFREAIDLPYGDRLPVWRIFTAYNNAGPRLASQACRAAHVREDRGWRDLTKRQQHVLLNIGEWCDKGHRSMPLDYDAWRITP